MTTTNAKPTRPLSPHLQVYRWTLTMAMSVVHRATGIALYAGTILLAWWLVAAAMGPEAFSWADAFFGSLIGRLVLFGYTWALIHHMLGGIKHFVWDVGSAFDPAGRELVTRLTLIGSVALTMIVWVVAIVLR
jgi:succinate dehydrogenase / fumarate reductase cytochrome b subunit